MKDDLLKLALNTVKSLKITDLTSAEKREVAFETIKASALETGQKLSDRNGSKKTKSRKIDLTNLSYLWRGVVF